MSYTEPYERQTAGIALVMEAVKLLHHAAEILEEWSDDDCPEPGDVQDIVSYGATVNAAIRTLDIEWDGQAIPSIPDHLDPDQK